MTDPKTNVRDTPASPETTRRPVWVLGLIVACVTVVFTLVVAEIALRVFAPVEDPLARLKAQGFVNQYIRSEFTPRFRLETEAEPGLPGITGRHVFTTNNVGLRGDSLAQPKPASEYRVFMIGGSTVEGLYLGDSESITAVLQRALADVSRSRVVKVYNAGKSGDKSDDHISMLAHRLLHLQPDLIIVMMGINDLRASILGFDYRHFDARPAFAVAIPERLRLRNLVTLAALEFQLPRRLYYAAKRLEPRTARDLQQQISLRSTVREAAEAARRLPQSDRPVHGDTAAFRRNLLSIIGLTAGQCVPLVLVTHPVTWRSTDTVIKRWHWLRAVGDTAFHEDRMDAAMNELNDVTRSEAARNGVPLFDLARIAARSTSQFYDDTHFNVAGAEAAGNGLARFLIDLGVPGPTRGERLPARQGNPTGACR